jgi:NADH-quinone oxidoreductase subunit J
MIESLQYLLFWVVAGVAIISAGGVVLNRNAVYSALSLLVNFCMLAVLYILLNAQFLAMVQVLVYAGAVIVLFLFVEMLLGATGRIAPTPWLGPQVIVVLVVAFLILTIVGSVVYERPMGGAVGSMTDVALNEIGQVQAIGLTLFTDYIMAVEMAAVLMLVGLVGAIVLGQGRRTAIAPRRETESPQPAEPTAADVLASDKD